MTTRRTTVLAALLGVLLVLYLCGVPGAPGLGWGPGAQYRVDLDVYRLGALAWLHGTPLYGPGFPVTGLGARLPFIYPPVAAVSFVPLAVVPMPVAVFALTVATVGLAVLVLVRTQQVVGARVTPLWLLTASVALLASDPMRMTLLMGQINVVLLALVVVDTVGTRPRPWRGVLVGVAAAVKLTPLVVVVWFLVRGDRRAAATTVATFGALTALGHVLAPAESVRYWTTQLLGLDPLLAPGSMWNQSLRAVVARWALPGPVPTAVWLLLAVAALAVAVWVARRCLRAGEPVLGLCAVLAGGLLASPISWSHHWIWMLPAVPALLHAGRRVGAGAARVAGRAGVLLALVGVHAALFPLEGAAVAWQPWQQVLVASFPLWGLTVLGVLAGAPHWGGAPPTAVAVPRREAGAPVAP